MATVAVLRSLLDLPDGDYGYRIMTRARVSSGTVYPILQRLERAGWIEGYWNGHGKTGQRRRFYEFTEVGRQKMHEKGIR